MSHPVLKAYQDPALHVLRPQFLCLPLCGRSEPTPWPPAAPAEEAGALGLPAVLTWGALSCHLLLDAIALDLVYVRGF